MFGVRSPPPQVTGISPKEGPPGTRVTIRGENLGLDARDIIGLRICGVDCLLSVEWKSPNKLITRTGQAKCRGDIIVQTKSGGIGTCTVQFRGYNIQIGPLQESAIWIDESQTFMTGKDRAASPAVVSQETDDPLGISDESSETKISEDTLQELFPEGSGNTSLDNFEPAWFLLENHHSTSFEDLKAGLSHLRNKSSHQKDGPLAFAKTNLSTFLDCYDTLSELNKKIEGDKAKTNGLLATTLLEETLLKANKASEGIFDDVLQRKDRADATRNTLAVLNRFKLLFYLPSTIEKNIEKGDYDLVITDYTRAKSLFWVTEMQAFKKVFNEIELRIGAFRETLRKKLLFMPSTVDEQKKLIRYLIHLEVEGDPAWDCILNSQNWLVTLMHKCKQEQLDKEEEEDKEFQRTNYLLSTSSSLAPLSSQPFSRNTNFKSGKLPQHVLLVELLTKILCENVPDFWRLGQSYLSGKLLKEVKKIGRADAAKHAQFKQLVHNIIMVYTSLIRAAFLAQTLSTVDRKLRETYGIWKDRKQETPLAWLPICVRHTRACILLLNPLELPAESMDVLQVLTWDLRWHCVVTLLTQAVRDVECLHERETWTIDTDDRRGGTTMLPAQFENTINETIHTLQEAVNVRPGEKPLFQDSTNEKVVSDLCTKIVQTFAATLNRLADNVESTPKTSTAITPKTRIEIHTESAAAAALPTLDKRLIIVLSNCALTTDHVIPRLVESLVRHGYPSTPRAVQIAQMAYTKVDEQLFRKYIEVKSNPIIGALEPNMYIGNFDWSQCSPATGARVYIKECVMSLLEVHAEVYSIGPTFVERVMRSIVYNVAEELTRLLQCVTKFSANGAVQASLDVKAFDLTIDVFKTRETQRVAELVDKFSKQMHFQLMCFKPDKRLQHCAAIINNC